jgi:hypothetical protein
MKKITKVASGLLALFSALNVFAISLMDDTNDDDGTNYYYPTIYPPPPTYFLGVQLTAPAFSGTNIYLNLQQADLSGKYDVYYTSNLPSSWSDVSSGTNGQTNFTLSMPSASTAFYRAARKDAALASATNLTVYFPDNITDTNLISVDIGGGVAAAMSALVDSTNLANAVWLPFNATPLLDIGTNAGLHTVLIGVKGTNGVVYWTTNTVTLDTTPPLLVITNPTASTVSTPMIQLQGYASMALTSLTFDVSNAAGIFTNQTGYVTSEFWDTNLLAFTTNYFQCYDVALTNGLNTVTLHATDLGDNTTTTNFNFTLDYSGDTTPPALTVLWPQSGAKISGTNFTLQAQMDDATATVTASIVDTNGDTNTVQGLVERSGLVWVDNLPLSSGTNTLTLTATDAAGNSTVTNLTLFQSSVMVTLNPLSGGQFNQSSVSVTGTVSDASCEVFVSGVEATVNGGGTWKADAVPVNPTGTATFDVEVYVGDPTLLGSQIFNQPQPATVGLKDYSLREHDNETEYYYQYIFHGADDSVINWDYKSGGSDHESGFYIYTPTAPQNSFHNYTDSLSAGEGAYSVDWENTDATTTGDNGEGTTMTEQNQIQTRVMIVPPGQQSIGQSALYLVMAQVINENTGLQLAAGAVQFMHQLAGTATEDVTNSDGSVWTEAVVFGAAGAPVEDTPVVAENISFTAMKVYQLQLKVVSNSAAQIDATNWAVVKSLTNDYVIVQATLNGAAPASVTNLIRWNGGLAVTNNPLQRWVSKTNSAETTVTASIGSLTNSLNVWVVWANLTIKTSGTLDSDDKADDISGGYWPTELGGGNGLGPINCQSTSLTYAYTIGKMEAKAILQPTGIGNLITNGWDMHRTKEVITWDNGGNYNSGFWTAGPSISNPPPGADDTSHAEWKYLNPTNGDIFDLDGPGCSVDLSGTNIIHTAEVYDNFFEYTTVNLGSAEQVCSTTNTWSYTAQVDIDATNKVQLNSLSTSLITLPTTSNYTNR